jgi:hypothetical protein
VNYVDAAVQIRKEILVEYISCLKSSGKRMRRFRPVSKKLVSKLDEFRMKINADQATVCVIIYNQGDEALTFWD